jgi:SAM-dependent methyltransferase
MLQDLTPQQLYAELYDVYVPDWPGEIDFYCRLISGSPLLEHGVLEIACGTGRVTLQLAGAATDITGLDLSPDLLDRARRKRAHHPQVRWVLGDIRSFELGRKFGLILSPGHSFQFMLTPEDQVKCLERIKHHLVPGGLLVLHLDHQDFGWLGGLLEQREPVFKTGQILEHPLTHQKYRRS